MHGMTKPSCLHVTAALLAAVALPASAQTYAAGYVTATPLPPLSAAKPPQATPAAQASGPRSEPPPDVVAAADDAIR